MSQNIFNISVIFFQFYLYEVLPTEGYIQCVLLSLLRFQKFTKKITTKSAVIRFAKYCLP